MISTSGGTLCCAWCRKDLSSATTVKYLNGNQPVCDLCLLRTQNNDPISREWNTPEEDEAWKNL